ncbi:MAG: 3-hydroxybutyrate dehydrogenase [Pseudomonadota bacterium]
MFKEKTVLITGSTSGIGLAIAEVFATQNANIILNGVESINEINPILEEMSRKTQGVVVYEKVNLAKPDEVEAMMTRIHQQFGAIDILINNACIQHVSPIEAFPIEKWDFILALGLSSVFHTIRLALPQMRAKGWGRIINIASVHGLVASAEKAAYVAAKHGVVGLTKVVALETAQDSITCNAICPGWVLTPLVQKQIEQRAIAKGMSVAEAEHDLLSEKQPSLAFVKPEDLAALALFLCKDEAAQMTGGAIAMDGGWVSR